MSRVRRVAAEHSNSRAKLGTAQRDHMLAAGQSELFSLYLRVAYFLPYMRCHNVTMIRIGMGQDILNEIIAVLIACDYNRSSV